MRRAVKDWIILAAIGAVYILFSSYQLWQLPGEWYNDITTEHQEVTAILAGGWPWRFNLSAGPAYHYIVAGFAYFLGPNYATYKLASLVTGLAVLPLLYLLGKELFGRRAGLLAAAVGSVSFWLILFARLGSSPQILAPVLSLGAVYFTARFARTCRYRDVAMGMALAGMGLFTYPATFVLPLVVLAIIGWQLVFAPERGLPGLPERSRTGQLPHPGEKTKPHRAGRRKTSANAAAFATSADAGVSGAAGERRPWGRALLVAIAVLIPFAIWFGVVASSSAVFSQSGYIGKKVAGSNPTLASLALTLGKNMLNALGMFQFVGDRAFRTNVSGRPVLDLVSGILMDLGLAWLLIDPRLRKRWGYVILPLVILLAPSAGPGIPVAEIPSASRALGAAPFVFLLVGLGLEAVWNFAARWVSERARGLGALSTASAGAAAAQPAAQVIPVTGRTGGRGLGGWFGRLSDRLAPDPRASRTATRAGWVVSGLMVTVLLAGVAYLNVERYFVAYAANLPEQNQPWGGYIARYIDSLPESVEPRMTSCCWGQWKVPDPQSVYYVLQHPHGRESLLAPGYTRTCADLKAEQSYALIFSPYEEEGLAKAFQACFPQAVGQMHYDALGKAVFYSLFIPPG